MFNGLDANLNLSEVVLMVVGNKADLDEERKVPTERPIREFKESLILFVGRFC